MEQYDLFVRYRRKDAGRTVVIAIIDDPRVIRRILTHLGLPTDVPVPRPRRSQRRGLDDRRG